MRPALRGRLVQELQEPVRGELDLLVPPLGGAIVTGDDSRAMDAAKVAVDEGEDPEIADGSSYTVKDEPGDEIADGSNYRPDTD